MKLKMLISVVMVVIAIVCVVVLSLAQNKAAVQMDKPGPIHAGGSIALRVKLNEPLPKGAYFQMRISPISIDQQIPLNSEPAVNSSQSEFRVSGTLPETAVPGTWHISTIYLFLAGTSWTSNTIAPNNLTFQVEGTSYPIPTKAEVSLVR
jgi:hypothetical protein